MGKPNDKQNKLRIPVVGADSYRACSDPHGNAVRSRSQPHRALAQDGQNLAPTIAVWISCPSPLRFHNQKGSLGHSYLTATTSQLVVRLRVPAGPEFRVKLSASSAPSASSNLFLHLRLSAEILISPPAMVKLHTPCRQWGVVSHSSSPLLPAISVLGDRTPSARLRTLFLRGTRRISAELFR